MAPTAQIDVYEARFRQSTQHIIAKYSVLQNKLDRVIIRGRRYGSGATVFIKYYTGSRGPVVDKVQAEFFALQRYHSAMSDNPSSSVPAPYDFVPDGYGGATIICEWINLWRGDAWFKLGMPFESIRRHGLRQSAAWLGRFHKIGGNEIRPLEGSLDVHKLASDYVEFGNLYGALSCNQDLLLRQKEILLAVLTSSAGKNVLHSKLHGDFTPANIFLAPGREVGFDFAAPKFGPVLLDMGKFLSALIWYGHFGIGGKRGEKFLKDGEIFLQAYPGEYQVHDELVVNIFYIRSLLNYARPLSAQLISAPEKKTKRGLANIRMIAEVLSHVLSRLG